MLRFFHSLLIFLLIVFVCPFTSGASQNNQTDLLGLANKSVEQKDFEQAKRYLNQAISESRLNGDTTYLLKGLFRLELLYSEHGQNDSAIAICYERLRINRLRKSYKSLSDNFRALNALLLTNIGTKTTSGLMDSCLYYALLSKDTLVIAVAYTNYGLGVAGSDVELGLRYLRKAVFLSNSVKDPIVFLYSRIQTSKVLIDIDSLNKAEQMLNEALTKAISINEKVHRTHIYIALGSIYLKEGRNDEAINALIKAKNLAKAGPYNYYLPDIYKGLVDVYRKTNRFDSSLFYSERAAYIQSKMVNEKVNQQVVEVNAKYQLDAKESAIKKLGNRIGAFKKLVLFIIIGSISVIAFFVVYFFKIKNSSKNGRFYKNQFVKGAKRISAPLPETFKIGFEKVFVEDEIFTQPDITLQKLAELLKTNTTYLSRFINDEYKTNFSQLLNQHRIEKACTLLLNDKMDNLTIEAIAQAAGFNSKSTFNSAFRSIKGVTPTQWRETNKQL